MSKTVEHVIPMLAQIEDNFATLYKNIATIDGQYKGQVKTAAQVLSRQEAEHAKYYRELLEEYRGMNVVVDDQLFNKIRIILNDFKNSIQRANTTNVKSFILYSIEFEKRNGEILVEIKEQITGDNEDAKKFANVLDQLIKAEENHVLMLENFLPKEAK